MVFSGFRSYRLLLRHANTKTVKLALPAHCCLPPPLEVAAVRPVIAAIRAERSILLAFVGVRTEPP